MTSVVLIGSSKMSETDKPMSLWDDTSTETIRVRKDDLNNRVDVAIVGAGYTGLSAAIHSTEKGMSCHVIEAEHVGYGGSGRNTGLVNAAAWLPPQDVIKQLGEKAGKKFVDIFGNNMLRSPFDAADKLLKKINDITLEDSGSFIKI